MVAAVLVLPLVVFAFLAYRQFGLFNPSFYIPYEEMLATFGSGDLDAVFDAPIISVNVTSGLLLSNMFSLSVGQLLLSVALGIVMGLTLDAQFSLRKVCELKSVRGSGVMYSLVALGFVLIFKASGVFNFAQGVLALFAALTLVGLMSGTIPIVLTQVSWLAMPAWLAIIFTIMVMIGMAFLIERIVLRPLVNQDPIILFMSTIGLAFVLEGVGDILWGSEVKVLEIGIPTGTFMLSGIQFETFDIWATVIAAVMVVVLAVFFQKTRIGRALRAVADDHQAALSVGIPLKAIWQ